MFIKTLLGGTAHDLLAPHFSFEQMRPGNIAAAERLMQVAALRYEVYCLECQFLDPDDYPRRIEMDEYDNQAVLATAHNPDGVLVGTVRLVQASAGQIYPFEEHCPVFENFAFPPREECAEISRLVVRKSFRRRPGDSLQGITKEFQEHGNPGSIAPPSATGRERRSNSPEILLGLYREIFRFSRRTGIHYWFAAMERSLARSLSRMGFDFKPVGPRTDYYGPVTLYMADLTELLATLEKQNPLLHAWFNDRSISNWMLFRTLLKTRLSAPGTH